MNKILLLLSFLMMICTTTVAQNKLVTPPYLKKGDTIIILAPAGILKPNRKPVVLQAKKLAESWGLKVILGKNMFKNGNHFAGTDSERCDDFQKALNNPNIKAIWAARGGYGSVRILDKLNFTKFQQNPKWIVGYSDITAFHNHIHNLGVETLHAMMATSLEEKPEDIVETIVSFKKALFGETLNYTIAAAMQNRTFNTKAINGQLVGGNLAILSSMLGSESQLNTANKILFIEEIGEYKYAIDRMLQSLKRANYFTKVNAVVIGNMSLIKKNSTKWGSTIKQLILAAIPADIPVVFNFPAGHEPDNRALIFGRNITITMDAKNVHCSFQSILD